MRGTPLVAGAASGELTILDEPLSFWGGFDSNTGLIIDQRHPQVGQSLKGCVVTMPGGRGSSSASSVLAEAIRLGTAPAAIVVCVRDQILVLGAVVAEALYGTTMPVVLVAAGDYSQLEVQAATGADAEIARDGQISFAVPSPAVEASS